ncbi:MAG: MgtC/SapB family protein [Candidatus Hydrogenedentes bacterium]|nr:MgtC/SapB family protein [Candidatus Hydrogenedentota bacterium]
MSIPPEVMDAVYKLVLATALGGLLGLERERKHRAAGLRTHIVVCLAATLVMIISNRLADEWSNAYSGEPLDRGRIVAGILQGIGFIGAGAIINVGNIHRGLTTAAMIWFAAVLGVAVGLGYFLLAACSTVAALAAVLLFEPLSEWVSATSEFSLRVRLPGGPIRVRDVEQCIEKHGYHINNTRLTVREHAEAVEMQFVIGAPRKRSVEDLIDLLNTTYPDIQELSVER